MVSHWQHGLVWPALALPPDTLATDIHDYVVIHIHRIYSGLTLCVYDIILIHLRIERIFGICIYRRDMPVCVNEIYWNPSIIPHRLHIGNSITHLFFSMCSPFKAMTL